MLLPKMLSTAAAAGQGAQVAAQDQRALQAGADCLSSAAGTRPGTQTRVRARPAQITPPLQRGRVASASTSAKPPEVLPAEQLGGARVLRTQLQRVPRRCGCTCGCTCGGAVQSGRSYGVIIWKKQYNHCTNITSHPSQKHDITAHDDHKRAWYHRCEHHSLRMMSHTLTSHPVIVTWLLSIRHTSMIHAIFPMIHATT